MPLSKLFIDRNIAHDSKVVAIRSQLNIPFEIVDNSRQVFNFVAAAKDPVQKGKEILFLTKNQGSFIRKCPGTRFYNCCGYMILHIGTFCTMDCSYCILQSYFHPPVLQYFVNHDDMIQELNTMFAQKNIRRIGTGEFTDSMIWEFWTDLSQMLVPLFSKQSYSMLELKTKTTAVDKLKYLEHNQKTVMAWSVNTEKVIYENERGTASLNSRLKAAAKCQKWGYPLAFHFDPMVIYDGCEQDYRHVVEQIFAHASKDNIAWISIGTFRFMPSLKPIIQKRFPDSKIVYGEFISGLDDKMRYFKPLRIKLYQNIYSLIKEIAPNVLVYFCMEDDDVWQKSFGFVPSDKGGLSEMLDKSAVMHCNLKKS